MAARTELALKMPKDESEKRLGIQIGKGRELLSFVIENASQLYEIRSRYTKWNKFNSDLLKVIFTNYLIVNEYYDSTKAHSGREEFSIEVMLGDVKGISDALYERINIQINCLESIVERLELYSLSIDSESKVIDSSDELAGDRNKVFIVHGHDNEAKQELARYIEKIGFEPIILHEQVSGSKTIIEKIEAYSNVGFGVVIYTPCDVGAQKSRAQDLQGRARQNVVFEHGYLIGKLGRGNVCSLIKGDIEKPNDISGIVYTSMDTSDWKLELAKELRAAGYIIDMNKVI